MDLLLAAILLSLQNPPAPAQTPHAAFTEWMQSLPAEHPRPFTQELELDFDLAFEELAGDEETLGYFESMLPDMDFDLRMNIAMLDAERMAYRIRGSADVALAADPEASISASGELGLIFDGKRIYGWADVEETLTEQHLKHGFGFDQISANGLYAEFRAAMPDLLALLPQEELPTGWEAMQRAMPPTLADYLHPRGYWRSTDQLFEATSFVAEGTRVCTSLRPNAELAAGLVAGIAAEAEADDLAPEQAQQLARGMIDGLELTLEFDRASGMPLDTHFRMSIPLELFEAGITGRMVFGMNVRSLAWERKAPAAEHFTRPEGIEWFDADTLLPLIRLGIEQALGKPDASEEDFEF